MERGSPVNLKQRSLYFNFFFLLLLLTQGVRGYTYAGDTDKKISESDHCYTTYRNSISEIPADQFRHDKKTRKAIKIFYIVY